jgi:hypothetical protein
LRIGATFPLSPSSPPCSIWRSPISFAPRNKAPRLSKQGGWPWGLPLPCLHPFRGRCGNAGLNQWLERTAASPSRRLRWHSNPSLSARRPIPSRLAYGTIRRIAKASPFPLCLYFAHGISKTLTFANISEHTSGTKKPKESLRMLGFPRSCVFAPLAR